MQQPTACPLTGYPLQNATFEPQTGPFIDYKFYPIGRARISFQELTELQNAHQPFRAVLAGICRNYSDSGKEPPMISSTFVEQELKGISYPKEAKEKVRHFIKYLYFKGGKDFQAFDFMSSRDYPIVYANSSDEFGRILDFAEKNYWIEWSKKDVIGGGITHYRQVQLTPSGIDEVEKELPQIPMVTLVNQAITTGDNATDEKINHAKDLFFQEPQTLDRMRSACEALSFVLEPMRENMKQYFQKDDVSTFFQIVNTFDIRHNKEQTKSIVHLEQLEWVFYTLLNTISTYCKLRARLEV